MAQGQSGQGDLRRAGPSVLNSVVGLQNTNILGTNTGTCVQDSASTKIFCNINFDTDPDGWAPTEHLVVESTPTPTPVPTPTPTPAPTPAPDIGIPVGTRVSVDVNGVFLRSGPSVLNSVVGLQNTNILGTNTASCVQDSASTKIFCNIDFDTDPDGWAPTEHLVVGSISTATPLPPPTSSSTTVGSAFDNFVQLDTTTQDNLEGCLRGRRLRYCQ